jgi:hypothetical protein
MAIRSNAFGRVTLTENDAKKFERQVTYGKPKSAAQEGLKRGAKLAQSLRDNGGKIQIKLDRG